MMSKHPSALKAAGSGIMNSMSMAQSLYQQQKGSFVETKAGGATYITELPDAGPTREQLLM
jgi:hypothetical protein